MSKTYALVDVDHTLLDDNGTLNEKIVASLLQNNIQDVYLFTDMRFQVSVVNERRKLIGQLTEYGLNVRGVLTTPDLFWAANSNDLTALDACMAKNNINLRFGNTLSDEQFASLKQECPSVGLALQQKRYQADVGLGTAFQDVDNSFAFEKSHGAKIAADILSTMLPGRPHPKALLFKHFLENKPADCTSCVIFEDKEVVIKNSIEISANNGIPVVGIQVKQEDFRNVDAIHRYHGELSAIKIYHHELSCLPAYWDRQDGSVRVSRRLEVEYANLVTQNGWVNTDALASQTIQAQYADKRGFKLFGYSSDDSLKIIDDLNKTQGSFVKRLIVSGFMSQDKNKGKRLYDVIIEQKIRHTQPQLDAQGNNAVWLTEDMIYLINQKYKQKRGFKLFGISSDYSIHVLKQLNDKDRSLSWKQDALQIYLNNAENVGKRLHDIITEVKNMIPNAAVPAPGLAKA